MPRGGPGLRKAAGRICKCCASSVRKDIDQMLLNGAEYSAIVARHRQLAPKEDALNAANLSRHKREHVLGQAITREETTEDGTIVRQTYLNGAYEAPNIVIPDTVVPEIPNLTNTLKIIIGCGLNNIVKNPQLVNGTMLMDAIKLWKSLGGESAALDDFLGNWEAVAAEKDKIKRVRTRKLTVEETTTTTATPAPVAIDAEWSDDELDVLALPPAEEVDRGE